MRNSLLQERIRKCRISMVFVIAVAYALFHIYTGLMGILPGYGQRIMHIACACMLVLLVYPPSNQAKSVYWHALNITLIGAVLFFAVYGMLYADLAGSVRAIAPNTSDTILAGITILLVLEVTRRLFGIALPLVAIVAILYALFGHLLPGLLYHHQYDFDRALQHIAFSYDGIMGMPIGVSSGVIAVFVIFGALLQKSGAGELLLDSAKILVGRVRGGAAKIAVVGSSLFGMLSGSAGANVAVTGTFTIPLMKRTGFSSHSAAAVEAVASTGSQLMPPIMGAAVFIMTQFVGRTYVSLIKSALFPAILYYVGLFLFVDSEAARRGFRGLEPKEIPESRILLQRIHLVIPVVVLIYFLAVVEMSPPGAVTYAILSILVVSLLRRTTRMSPKQVALALSEGAMVILRIAAACACAGIVVGVISLTGLGFKFSSLLLALAGDNLVLLLFVAMLGCIILGMGMPTVACYITLAILVAPALVQLGVNVIAAHFFIFYFGVLSGLTPPVAIVAYIAAGLADAKPLQTAVTACRMGFIGIIMPFVFVLTPSLLLEGTWMELLVDGVGAGVGLVAIVGGISGYLLIKIAIWWRLLLIVGAAFLLWPILPGMIGDITGYLLVAVAVVSHVLKSKRMTIGIM